MKCPFTKGKSYFAAPDHQLKFVEQKMDGYYVFKITNDPVWDEFETKDEGQVFPNKTTYLKALKELENQ